VISPLRSPISLMACLHEAIVACDNGKTIVFCWIPSHLNIRGNERADVAAKSAFSLWIANTKLPAYEPIPHASRFCLDEWQDIWNCCQENKFHSIYHTVGIVPHSKNSPRRRDSVVINGLRIGHCQLGLRASGNLPVSYVLTGNLPVTYHH